MGKATIIGAVGALCAAVAFLGASLQEARYTAETSLVYRGRTIAEAIPGAIRVASPETAPSAATTEALLLLPVLAERTAKDLPGDISSGDIARAIDVQMHPGDEVVTLEATASNPNSAATIANAYAEEAVTFYRSTDRDIVRSATARAQGGADRIGNPGRREQVGRILRHLRGRLHTIEVIQLGDLELVEKATPPVLRSFPRPGTDALLGLLVGICVGSMIVGLAEARERIADVDSLRRKSGAPLIGAFTDVAAISGHSATRSGCLELHAGSLEMLLARIRYYEPAGDRRVLLITSAGAAEGKSTISRGLVAAANAAGIKSNLIEADRIGSASGRIPAELEIDGHELTVMDGRAFAQVGEIALIPDGVEGVIVIGRIGRANVREMEALSDALRASGAPVLGVVANFASPQDPQVTPFLDHRLAPPLTAATV